MVYNGPFISFFTPQHRSEPDALLGFALPLSLPDASIASAAMQLHLVRTLWNSKVTALELRFVTTTDLKTTIYLLSRIRRPAQVDRRAFADLCVEAAMQIVRICKDCGYDQLQPLTSEKLLKDALDPFPVQALAEVRRHEAIELMEDPFTEYDVYVPYAWEWATREQLPLFALLTRLRSPGIISIYLEPTKLYPIEQSHLLHATQMRNRLLSGGSALGEKIYRQYEAYEQRLQQPYLLRICLAFPTKQALANMGQEILDQTQHSAVLQYPQNRPEWQAAQGNLQRMQWIPWGNLSEDMPGTARLRYLVDSQGASMGFHLPVKPDPKDRKIKVLLIFAESTDRPLNLGMDDRIIREAIQLSSYRDNISLTSRHAATISDLRRALLNEEFQIVHIASHGGPSKGLKLLNEIGDPVNVPPQALAKLFQAYRGTLQCVVLNACYSLSQGQLVAQEIPFTIAMEGELGNNEAREFAKGFYDGLGAGLETEAAYQQGCLAAEFVVTDERFRPKLFKNA